MSEARVKVSVADGTIEIEGAESFVSAQLEKFGESIRAGLAAKGKNTDAEAGAKPAGVSGLDRVFTATDRGVQILTDIPGESAMEKMANAGKLLAYGMAALKNRRAVLFEEVIAACKAHRCYGRKNLATALKKQKSAFVFGGRGRKQTIALTESGTKEVERMLKTLSPSGAPAGAVRSLT
ncbi:MAG TPA: hypothetical protein VGY57_03790 [Vicinamibacterales bacterium]|nr:hypothetical protein [Vicinamibacterales bacterium]